MKVCIIVKNSIWFDPRVRKQIIEYRNNNIDVHCIGLKDNKYDSEKLKQYDAKFTIVDVNNKYYGPKRNFFTKILRELQTNRLIKREIIKTKPDIIHANDLNALIPSYKASKKTKSIVIYDTHEIFIENPWIASKRIIKFVWYMYEKNIINKVDLVVAVSNAATNYLINKYNIKKIMVVTNSIMKDQILQPKKWNTGDFQVLNHGQFYIGRGYEIMIDAANISKNEKIKYIIRGYGELEEMLRNKIINTKCKKAKLVDPVPVNELIEYASKSWIGLAITEPISINFKLSVSNKIFEYAAAGLPVIMSNIPEHRYLNAKYNFGIILNDNTPKEINKAVDFLYENKALYEQMSINAINFSYEMNWETQFYKLIDFERQLLEKRKNHT